MGKENKIKMRCGILTTMHFNGIGFQQIIQVLSVNYTNKWKDQITGCL